MAICCCLSASTLNTLNIEFFTSQKVKVFYIYKKVKPQNKLSRSDISGFPLVVNNQSRNQSENNQRCLKQLKVIV